MSDSLENVLIPSPKGTESGRRSKLTRIMSGGVGGPWN
jgi:hypothetical protein